MKILFLYNNPIAHSLSDWLLEQGNEVINFSDKLNLEEVRQGKYDLIISYTYRYIISADILKVINYNVINLHISYLPFNKGANPNQWSFIENTPKGVTIHYIDETLDTGDIIAQELVDFSEEDTLHSSYIILNETIINLFKKIYPYYKTWGVLRKKAIGKGTYHSVKDFELYKDSLKDVKSIKVKAIADIIQKGR